jgi:hypothetical protein
MTRALLDCPRKQSGPPPRTAGAGRFRLRGVRVGWNSNTAWTASVATGLAYIATLATRQTAVSWVALAAALASGTMLILTTRDEVAALEPPRDV